MGKSRVRVASRRAAIAFMLVLLRALLSDFWFLRVAGSITYAFLDSLGGLHVFFRI